MDNSDKLNIKIDIKDLIVNYSDFNALSCSEAFFKGNIIAVIGHNGAGKSTLIKTILGLLKPNTGSIKTFLQNPDGNDDILSPEKNMAFCPETGSVFADISVESYIRFWCRFKHRDANFYKKKGSKYIEMFQLTPLLAKLGRALSKGQRRRVQTAIGFLINPTLFLFDEPFDGLDVQKTHELTNIIIAHAPRMAFFITSHRMDVMERLADYFIVMEEGKFISYGDINTVCKYLGGVTYIIHSPNASNEIMRSISSKYPYMVLNSIGNNITVTGKNISQEDLNTTLRHISINDFSIEEIQPSLVDAMNYHLKNNN